MHASHKDPFPTLTALREDLPSAPPMRTCQTCCASGNCPDSSSGAGGPCSEHTGPPLPAQRTDDGAGRHRPPTAAATALTELPPSPANSRVLLLPPPREPQAEGKCWRRGNQGSSPAQERRPPGRRWRREPGWGGVQVGGGARLPPGQRAGAP